MDGQIYIETHKIGKTFLDGMHGNYEQKKENLDENWNHNLVEMRRDEIQMRIGINLVEMRLDKSR